MRDIKIQWHPAFDAAIQIDLEEYADSLIYESEHLLSKKPIQIDILIIKKTKDIQIKRNIGRRFKLHNIIEYKAPNDYLSLNDFYKVYGYTCLYQSSSDKIGQIDPSEITITFVCNRYPRKMLTAIKKHRKIEIEKYDEGIYYLNGDPFDMQLIITSQLSKKNNYWLQSLRTDLKAGGEIRDLMDNYEPHKTSQLYKALMDTIVRANWEEVEVEKKMCDALKELFADELMEARDNGLRTGKQEASDNIRELICQFLKENRLDDLKKATENKEYWDVLINESHSH